MICLILCLLCIAVSTAKTTTARMSITMSGSNLIVGLNPALQRTVSLGAGLTVGSVNRAQSVEVGVGGKGQNALVASAFMQLETPSYILQFLGQGPEGDSMNSILAGKMGGACDLSKFTFRTSASCRTCITLVDTHNGQSTEIIEPSGVILKEEIVNLVATLDAFKSNDILGLAIMGSMPPGCPVDLYSQIIRSSCNSKSTVLIDSVVGTFESLGACITVACKTTFLKVTNTVRLALRIASIDLELICMISIIYLFGH